MIILLDFSKYEDLYEMIESSNSCEITSRSGSRGDFCYSYHTRLYVEQPRATPIEPRPFPITSERLQTGIKSWEAKILRRLIWLGREWLNCFIRILNLGHCTRSSSCRHQIFRLGRLPNQAPLLAQPNVEPVKEGSRVEVQRGRETGQGPLFSDFLGQFVQSSQRPNRREPPFGQLLKGELDDCQLVLGRTLQLGIAPT